MVNYIAFGKCNKNYIYIFLTIVFWILLYMPEFIIDSLKKKEKIDKKVEDLYKHGNILNTLFFFPMIIFSFILKRYESKLSKSVSNDNKLYDSNASNSNKGCYNDIQISEEKKKKNLNNKKNILNIIIIVSICFFLQSFEGIIFVLKIFSNWMVILLVTSFINTKLFNIKIYKHQKCAIAFIFSILFIFQLTSFILSIEADDENEMLYNKYLWLFPIGLIIYIFNVSVFSYVYSKIKWFMDMNWISSSNLLIYFSLLGFFVNIIVCLLFTFFKCGKNENLFCDKQKDGFYYIDSFIIFFENLLKVCREGNTSDLIIVISLFFANSLFLFLYYFFFISILKNLYPEYYFFTGPIRETIKDIISILQSKIVHGYYFTEKDEDDYTLPLIKFIFYIIGNSLTIFGFLIYLEIIELNFCGFNYNLRKNIIDRSMKDIEEIDDDDIDQNDNLIDDNTPNRESELSVNP